MLSLHESLFSSFVAYCEINITEGYYPKTVSSGVHGREINKIDGIYGTIKHALIDNQGPVLTLNIPSGNRYYC